MWEIRVPLYRSVDKYKSKSGFPAKHTYSVQRMVEDKVEHNANFAWLISMSLINAQLLTRNWTGLPQLFKIHELNHYPAAHKY